MKRVLAFFVNFKPRLNKPREVQMRKLFGKTRDTLATMWLATYYSVAFCWRNAKGYTIARLIIGIVTGLVSFTYVQLFGRLVNVAQEAITGYDGKPPPFLDFIKSDLGEPILFLLGLLLIGLVAGACNWFFMRQWTHILRYANSREINDHRATLDIARYRSKEFDDLCRKIDDIPMSWGVRYEFASTLNDLFATVVSFSLFGLALIWINPLYALVMIVCAIPMIITEFGAVTKMWNLISEVVPDNKARHVLERPFHNKTTFVQGQMFNQLPHLREQIKVNTDGILGRFLRTRRLLVRQEIWSHLIVRLSFYSVVVHALWMTITNTHNIGAMTVVIAAANTMLNNLEHFISSLANQWNTARGVVLIEQDLFSMKPLISTENPVKPEFSGAPAIEFRNVCFAYPPSSADQQPQLVLKLINLTIARGAKVAIVGRSGNGKSTLAALLLRHYDPSSGEIYADGINLKNIAPSDWNRYVAALTQEYTILDRRISDEIASSRLGEQPDPEFITQAVQFANFGEVLSGHPDGINAQIGTEFGGREFSGGEKQRLALARVHYRRAPVLVLDEPDARLDPENAQKVIDHIFALRGVTVILITHHVSRAEDCDLILFMEGGEIVERGTHDQLMKLNGRYKKMYEKDKKRLGVK
jgi:ATP-binding cassette, subfamily B, bacterial